MGGSDRREFGISGAERRGREEATTAAVAAAAHDEWAGQIGQAAHVALASARRGGLWPRDNFDPRRRHISPRKSSHIHSHTHIRVRPAFACIARPADSTSVSMRFPRTREFSPRPGPRERTLILAFFRFFSASLYICV